MKNKSFIALALVLSVSAFGSVRVFNSSNVDLGSQNFIKCGTGVTCAVSSGKLQMSVPALDGVEGGDATLTLSADESDDNGDDWKLVSVASGNSFQIRNDTSGSDVAKFTMSTAGAVTMVSTLAGYLAPQVAATATTITAAQCGSTFSNSGAVQMELPEASTVIGCTLAFVTLNATNFDVNPDNGDQILTQTNAAGDAMRNATVGNSIVIRAVSASQWATMAANGTWSDIN